MNRAERPSPLPLAVLGAAIVLAGAVILHFGRGTTFYYDEWNVVLTRLGHDPGVFLRSHNGHNSFLPLLLYKTLFETAGLEHYAVYRVVHLALMELVAVLAYLYARPRLGAWWALGPAVALTLVGHAPDYVLQTFQLTFSLSLVAGVAALLAFDRGTRWGDAAGSALLVASLFSSGLGVAFAVGAAVEVLLRPDRRRRLWVLAAPALLYGAWYLAWGWSDFEVANLIHAPRYAEEMYVAGVGALTSLTLGAAVVAVAFAALTVVALAGSGGARPRLWGLAAAAITFWVLTAGSRYGIAPPNTGRYQFPSAVLVALLACEVLGPRVAGRRVGRRGALLAGAALAALLVNDWGLLQANQGGIPDASRHVRAELGALELVRGRVAPEYRPDPGRAPDVTAGQYFGAIDRYKSSPADSPGKIARAAPGPRAAADRVLGEALGLGFARVAAILPPDASTQATPFQAVGGTASRDARGCVRFRRDGPGASLRLVVPAGRVAVAAGPADVVGAAGRFGDDPRIPLGSVVRDSAGAVRLEGDAVPDAPWRVSLASDAPFTACVLR